ncbi:MAG: metallophosphoesterase [Ginsengibacter sp.]
MPTRNFLKLLAIYLTLYVAITGLQLPGNSQKNFVQKERLTVPDTPNRVSTFLVISDIHLNSKSNQALSGEDAGRDLWDSAKIAINTLLNGTIASKPKFLLVLGDLPFHVNDDLGNLDAVRNSFDTVYNDLCAITKKARIPLIIVPGNNDSYDGDYHELNPDHAVPLFNPGAEASLADTSLSRIGIYSVYPMGKHVKLRLIVLNTVIFSTPKENEHFFYGTDRQAHTSLQMTWFRNQLKVAAYNKETVLIAMHIPPGNDGYPACQTGNKYLWDSSLLFEGRRLQNAFLDITDSFKNNIAGLLASHTHMDGIRLLQKNDTAITSLLISVPAITPGHQNNPSMKLITYNPLKNFELEDFTTIYMKYWNHNKKGSVTNFKNQYTFKGQFKGSGTISILAHISNIFQRDRKQLINDIDNIYTVENVPAALANNNDTVTIYVKPQ